MPVHTIHSSALAEALALHQHGRLHEAEARYGRILAKDPGNVAAHYHQGLARLQRGDFEGGIAALKQVLKLAPEHIEAHFNLGQALLQHGRHAEALPHFQRLTVLRPDAAEAWFYLGMTLCSLGRQAEALPYFERAIALKPDLPESHHNLASALSDLERDQEAAARFEDALALRPEFPEALVGLGNVLCRLDRHQEGVECYKRAIFLKPDFAEAYRGWGAELSRLGEHQAARECYEKVLALQPDDVMALNDLGLVYMELGETDAARNAAQKSLQIQKGNADTYNLLGLVNWRQGQPGRALGYFAQALQFKPAAAGVYMNRGGLYRDIGEYDKAMADYAQASKLKPDYPDPHLNRGLLLLAKAEFEEGWREYEYGLLCGERVAACREYPRWHGESLANQTVLICAEQGLGDEIMFASVLPEIIEQAGHCVVECDAKLVPIYQRSFPSVTVISRRKPEVVNSEESLPHIDVQSPVGSLPLYRRNRLEDFPQHVGYLKADPVRVAYWKARLNELGPGLKVGISWRGGTPKTGVDRRSIPLTDWLPVFKLKGVQFVSLQYTECSAEIAELEQAHGVKVKHWQAAIDNYDETAALVCAVDLVITVQTAIFHLGGALGRPVWGLLPIPAEWRYMLEGESLPWYPSARLFRQSAAGNWNEVMRAVAADLGCDAAAVPREETGLA